MESVGSQPKRTGAATTAATGIGAEGSSSGSVESRSVGGEPEPSAEEGQTKVLNGDLMERVMGEDNPRAAYLAAKANKGAAGVEGRRGIARSTREGRDVRPGRPVRWSRVVVYPTRVRAVEIPKPGGGTRRLGIPTVLDRFIQQALHQEMDRIFDPTVSEHSYGFP